MSSDKVAHLRKADAAESDPFEQAKATEQTEEIGSAIQIQDLDPELPEVLSTELAAETPEPVNRPEPVAKPATSKSGKGAAYTAMGMSLVAIAVSGLSIVSQQGGHTAVTEHLTSLESYVTEARQQVESVIQQTSENTKAIEINTQKLHAVSDLRGEMLVYNSALEQMKGDFSTMRGAIAEGQVAVGEQRSAIENVTGRVAKLESRQARTVTKIVRPKVAPAPQAKTDPTRLEGAILASIDAWGSQTNVMLRDPNGQWIPLSRGDFYKGWQLISTNGSKATFRNGKKSRTLQVEG